MPELKHNFFSLAYLFPLHANSVLYYSKPSAGIRNKPERYISGGYFPQHRLDRMHQEFQFSSTPRISIFIPPGPFLLPRLSSLRLLPAFHMLRIHTENDSTENSVWFARGRQQDPARASFRWMATESPFAYN